MRPHGGVRALAGAKVQRLADAGRPALRFAVQYVPASRAAARADCQSRRGISSRRARPSSGGLLLFCSQNERRALLQPHAGRTQPQCRAVAPPAGPDRAGTEQRRCAARRKRRHAKETGAPKAQLMTKANAGHFSKKQMILELARGMRAPKFTPAEVEQIRRQLITQLGAAGKTSPDYIAGVLETAGLRVVWSTRADTEGHYEEEFHDLLHFANLEEAEMCLIRLDELLRKFQAEGENAAAERVLEVARLGRRRAEMIARNHKVDPEKRAEKEEIMQWFKVWLETPDAFFDWLDVRKTSPDFQKRFAKSASADA